MNVDPQEIAKFEALASGSGGTASAIPQPIDRQGQDRRMNVDPQEIAKFEALASRGGGTAIGGAAAH